MAKTAQARAAKKRCPSRITTTRYLVLKNQLIKSGYEREITWAENVGACTSAEDFAREHAFVVCNSGMKAQIATQIFNRVWRALRTGRKLSEVFGHIPKCVAMQWVYDNREKLFEEFRQAKTTQAKLEFMLSLPHIGEITVYHLAKNFGVDCCKPDRHLVRLAAENNTTPEKLCERLARATGDRIATVDMVLWRAANLGII